MLHLLGSERESVIIGVGGGDDDDDNNNDGADGKASVIRLISRMDG